MAATRIAQYIYDRGYTSNLQINKLLYICFGFYGARQGGHLFGDVIKAWPMGPVVPSVYSAHKMGVFGRGKKGFLFPKEVPVVRDVLEIYGEKAPFLLVGLTHQEGTPWSNAYVAGGDVEIRKGDIIRYYTGFLAKADDWVGAMSTDDFREMMVDLSRT